MRVIANAKINLTLDITGVRPDGFHTLCSVMAPVSLCDEIVINSSESSGIGFDCSIKELCTQDNLCVRAAKLFFENIGKTAAAAIYLDKKIPFPAGLGGGSADAAAVLRGLNEMYGFPLTADELLSLAARLGSDVPLCLKNRACICEGRGEVLTEIDIPFEFDIVIAIGKARLSTPEVYRKYDAAGPDARHDTEQFVSAIKSRDFDKAIDSLGNAFEPITDILAPETCDLRARMTALGALNARLSGSGPAVYGIFENAEKAKIAAEALKKEGYFAVICKNI